MKNFVISGFGDEAGHDLREQMQVLGRNSIRFLEIRKVSGKTITDYSIAEVKAIKEELDAGGFGVSAIGSPIGKIGVTDPFEAHLDLFKHTIEVARIFGTRYIRMFSFVIPKEEAPEQYRDEVMRRLEQLVAANKGSGVTLLHENEKHIYGENAERCLDIFKHLPDIRGIFDPANFVQAKVDTKMAYDMLEQYIDYMHVKDARFADGVVVPAGQGDGNVSYILKKLHDKGRDVFLSIEPHLKRFEGIAAEATDAERFDVAAGALKNVIMLTFGSADR